VYGSLTLQFPLQCSAIVIVSSVCHSVVVSRRRL